MDGLKLGMAAMACGLLAACGGGGDDAAAPPPPSTFQVPTDTRSESAGGSSNIDAANFASFTDPLARLVVATTSESLVGTTLSQGPASRALSVATVPGGRVHPRADDPNTEACEWGGSLTVSAIDADRNGRLSPADSVTLVADNCVCNPSQAATNGRMTLRINAVDLDAQSNATALDANGLFSDFSVGSAGSLTGDFRLWARQDSATDKRQRLSYRNLSASVGQQTVQYNVDTQASLVGASGTYAIDGAISIGGQAYKVVQGVRFGVTDSDVPSVGSISLQDAAGDTLRLTAKQNGKIDFEFLPAGSSTATHTLVDQSWRSFQ